MNVGYVTGLGRVIAGATRLSKVLVQESFSKRTAVRKFRQALVDQGLPQEVVSHLTGEYAQMVSLNPLAYARGLRVRRTIS